MLLLEHTCDVYRNTPTGTNHRRALQQVGSGVPCLALPMTAPATIQNGFDLGKAYDFYFDVSADIKVKDKLSAGGKDYTVTSVMPYNVPNVAHLHVLAQQEIGT